MARRNTRQLIRDRLEQACRSLDTCESKLADAERLYFEAREERGMELQVFRNNVLAMRDLIARWRLERT